MKNILLLSFLIFVGDLYASNCNNIDYVDLDEVRQGVFWKVTLHKGSIAADDSKFSACKASQKEAQELAMLKCNNELSQEGCESQEEIKVTYDCYESLVQCL